MSNPTNQIITNEAANRIPLPNRRYYWNNLELLEVGDAKAYTQACVQAALDQRPMGLNGICKQIPEDWPTDAMVRAGCEAGIQGRVGRGFLAMLTAAPAVPEVNPPGAIPTIRTKRQAQDAIKVCNALTDVVGDDEQHPLFKMMDDLMTAIGAWEDADPELQAFFNSGDAPSAEQLTQVGMRLAHTGSEHQPSELGEYTGPVEVEYHNGTKQTANVGAIDWHRVVAYQIPEDITKTGQCQGYLTQCPTCDNVTARCVGVNPQPGSTSAD